MYLKGKKRQLHDNFKIFYWDFSKLKKETEVYILKIFYKNAQLQADLCIMMML